MASAEWFNVVHIQPPGSVSSGSHWDVARLVFHSMESIGHRASLQVNRIEAEATNILIGYEGLYLHALAPGTRYIPYQLEQIAAGGRELTPAMRQTLERATAVWDYHPHNIAALAAQGIQNVRLLPMGFHEKLATIERQEEDVDVLFYGLMNERRRSVVRALESKCNLACLSFVYGEARDTWIARSKIILNMHFYPAHIPEQVRVSYLLNNRRCVVSEESAEDPLGEFCRNVSYENLVEACLELLANEGDRQRLADDGYEGFKRNLMAENLREVMEKPF